jgi:cleavage and polyadenylation specificity factor subunit 3
MFLEAQFGAENCIPIDTPKVPVNGALSTPNPPSATKDEEEDGPGSSEEDEEREMEAMQKSEMDRLHKLGIPVPGVEIKVDKMVAKVWLEDLEVECANRVFGDRVRAVVERAVEVTAPLWA